MTLGGDQGLFLHPSQGNERHTVEISLGRHKKTQNEKNCPSHGKAEQNQISLQTKKKGLVNRIP